MCGIVGYIGKRSGIKIVLDGLQSLEYRGYDSAGIASINQTGAKVLKQVGQVKNLAGSAKRLKLSAPLVIGHTRWATHGSPSQVNAHPHTNTSQTIFAVHNGIIENYAELKAKLQKNGYVFKSDTDTEVIPQLIDFYFSQSGDFESAFRAALQDLRGAYAIAVSTTHKPETLYAARLSSPLLIGVGKNEFILASDATALLPHTRKVIYLNDYDIAILNSDEFVVHNLKKGQPIKPKAELLDFDKEQALLGNFPHFMLKEIFEAPQTVRSATSGRAKKNLVKLGGLENVATQLKFIDRLVIVACGTSYYSGLVGEYLIEEVAGMPVEVQLASEFKYRNEPFSRSTAILVISQSGETADTIAALKKVEDFGILRLGIVNTVGSTIARMTDAGVYCHAGPEQAVASTKAFIAQVTVLALIALHLSNGATKLFKPLLAELELLPDKIMKVLSQAELINKTAKKYKNYRDFLFIGRGYGYPCALEGALKLKEVSYIHAEGYASGEMKHGPLALINEDFPSLVVATDSPLLQKTYSNIEEIRARKGPIIAIATEGNHKIKGLADDIIYIPDTLEQTQPLLLAIVLQLLAYYIAASCGLNVDRPRNLAKSVTVE